MGIDIMRISGQDPPDELELLVDLLITIVYSCMHAQQHVQIQDIKAKGYNKPPPQIVAMLPPVQQAMIAAGCPPAGYNPHNPQGVQPNQFGNQQGGFQQGGYGNQ